jgi:hypothetical protein
MAAVAIAGIGMMMVCSSSLTAVMLMGGEEETPTTSAQSAAGPTGDEDDDSAGDEEGGVGGHEWRFAPLTKIGGGAVLKSIDNSTVDECKQECIKNEACVGFKRKRQGTKTCVLYSGDVSTFGDVSRHSYLLTRV